MKFAKTKIPLASGAYVEPVQLRKYVKDLAYGEEWVRLEEERTSLEFCHRLRRKVPTFRDRCVLTPKPAICSGCRYNREGRSRRE